MLLLQALPADFQTQAVSRRALSCVSLLFGQNLDIHPTETSVAQFTELLLAEFEQANLSQPETQQRLAALSTERGKQQPTPDHSSKPSSLD